MYRALWACVLSGFLSKPASQTCERQGLVIASIPMIAPPEHTRADLRLGLLATWAPTPSLPSTYRCIVRTACEHSFQSLRSCRASIASWRRQPHRQLRPKAIQYQTLSKLAILASVDSGLQEHVRHATHAKFDVMLQVWACRVRTAPPSPSNAAYQLQSARRHIRRRKMRIVIAGIAKTKWRGLRLLSTDSPGKYWPLETKPPCTTLLMGHLLLPYPTPMPRIRQPTTELTYSS